LCLCHHKENVEKKYMQFFPIRNLGETIYLSLALGRLNNEQIKDMYENWVTEQSNKEWKPRVIVLDINSIRSVTFRQIEISNNTVTRLVDRLAQWKGIRVSTAPVVATEA